MDKGIILLALLGCVALQVYGRPSYKHKTKHDNGFYPSAEDKEISWDKVKVKVDSERKARTYGDSDQGKDTYRRRGTYQPVWGKLIKPADQDPNILRGQYRPAYQDPNDVRRSKTSDPDPDNTWLEADSEEQEWSGDHPNAVARQGQMQDDQESSGWFSDDDEDDRTYQSKQAMENELDYIEDDVQYNGDKIYDIEDDLTFDELKMKRMEKQMRKMKKTMKNLQNLVKTAEKENNNNDLPQWQDVESKYEARSRRGRYYEVKA